MNNKQYKMQLSNGVPEEFNTRIIKYDANFYILPFEIEPTKGKSDFNTSEETLECLSDLTIRLRKLFDGNSESPGFPYWNQYHSKLVELPDFNLNDFIKTPEMTAKKVIYSLQHIDNNLNSEDWFNEITQYIDFVIDSFGRFPYGFGMGVFYEDFIRNMIVYLNLFVDMPEEKKIKLKEYFAGYLELENQTDLNLLYDVYQKWLNIFPFDLNSYFGELKEYFSGGVPVFDGGFVRNKYSGALEVSIHNNDSLIVFLLNITNELLTKINGVVLYENGLITDTNKLKVELVINNRKLELKFGYNIDSNSDQEKFRVMIEKWFEDEKRFIDEITPYIKKSESIKGDEINKKEIDLSGFKYNNSHIALIFFYTGKSINSKNANSILDNFKIIGNSKNLVEKYNKNLNKEYRIYGNSSETNRSKLAKIKIFNTVINFLKSNELNTIEAEKDFEEFTKYL
ncbi:MAG: hypothetical protein ACOYMD_06295 [Paludibacter sp.]